MRSPKPASEEQTTHPSKYMVIVSVLTVMVLLNLPGRAEFDWGMLAEKDSLKPTYPRFETAVVCLHGWPLTFLRRDPLVDNAPPLSPRVSYWQIARGLKSFNVFALLLNVLVAGLIAWSIGRLYQRWRRRRATLLQLHVIDVLAISGVVAIGFYILAYNHRLHDNEQQALEQITVLHPKSVNWGDRALDRSLWKPSRIAWIKDFHDHQYTSVFDRIVGFNVGGEELPLLTQLKHIQYVMVRGDVTNQQLRALTQLPELIVLDLSVRQLINSGESAETSIALPPLPHLRALNFGGSAEFQGAGLEGLQAIEVLDLSGTSLNDEGLAKLGQLEHLKHLYLDATEITNEGLASLTRLQNLERLSIRFVGVNEHGLRHLAQLKNLRWLYLYRSDPLSEEEQLIVASMKNLQNPDLGLADDLELRALKNAFPDDRIWRTR